jgi:hypothetical protein
MPAACDTQPVNIPPPVPASSPGRLSGLEPTGSSARRRLELDLCGWCRGKATAAGSAPRATTTNSPRRRRGRPWPWIPLDDSSVWWDGGT